MKRSKLATIMMLSTIALLTLLVSVVFGQDRATDSAAGNAAERPEAGAATPAIPLPPMTNPGLYMIEHAGDRDPARYFVKGNLRTFDWGELNPAQGTYNWALIDDYLTAVSATGKRAAIGISTYNARCCGGIHATPDWVWQSDPRAVVITGSCPISATGGCPDGQWRVPRYWHRAYLGPYETFVQALGNRYKADTRVEWISMGFGTYGENKAGGTQGEIDVLASQGLTSGIWLSTTKEIVDTYSGAFRSSGNLQKGLFIQIAPYTFLERERWDLANYAVPRGVGISLNGLVPDFNEAWRGPQTCSNTNFCGMYDTVLQNYTSVPIAFETYEYMLCDNTTLYWAMLSGMDKKADVLRLNYDLFYHVDATTQQTIDNIPNLEVFSWMKDYVGKTALTTDSVWVAMREHRNPTTYCYAPDEQTYYPQPGNYSFFLTQDDAVAGGRTVAETNVANTSYLGWCGAGINDPSGNPYPCNNSPYNSNLPAGRQGWVARRTDGVNNPYMWFKVSDGYLYGGDNTVKIAVTYADLGTDTFKVEYESTTGLQAAALEGSGQTNVVKTNSRTWKTATFIATHARMANGLSGGSDFRINSNSDGDEHIHLVMANKHATGYAGPPLTFTPSPTPTNTPTPTSTPTPTATPTPRPQTGHVAGVVFDDRNHNSVWDNNEPPIAGAVVRLKTPPNTVVTSVTTGADGTYTLSNVQAGSYLLEEIAPAGYTGSAQIGIQVQAGNTFSHNFPNNRLPAVYLPWLRK